MSHHQADVTQQLRSTKQNSQRRDSGAESTFTPATSPPSPHLWNVSGCGVLLDPVRFCLDPLSQQFVDDAGVVLGLVLCTATGERPS